MKLTLLILPAIASVLALGMLGSQVVSLRSLEQENAALKQSILDGKRSENTSVSGSRNLRPERPSLDNHPIDWLEVLRDSVADERSNGPKDMRKMISFQRRLQSMSVEEIVSALDHFKTLDISDVERQKLEKMLLGPLAEKAPQLALSRFSHNLAAGDFSFIWPLSAALTNWAEDDLGAATTWFDREIAAGTFESKALDGQSRSRVSFESVLIMKMIGQDLDGVETRLSAIAKDDRKQILNSAVRQEDTEVHDGDYARLIRSQLDAKDGLDMVAQKAASFSSEGDFSKTEAYLDRIDASPYERSRGTEDAAKSFLQVKSQKEKISTADIDKMREWLGSQTPGAVDRVTGTSIGQATNGNRHLEFSEGSALALKYFEASGSDDVLVGFLGSTTTGNHEIQARELAEKILDPVKRSAALDKLK